MIDKFGRTELGRNFYDPSSSATTGDLYIRTDGNSTIISDINFNSHKIINLAEPTGIHEAATKGYVDAHSSGGGGIGIITSDLDLNTHKLINVVNPTNLQDAVTKNYVDASTSQCVKTDGSSTISGNINLNSHKLINVTDPTNSYDAATKNYVDSTLNTGLVLAQKSNYIGIDVNAGMTSLGSKSQILPVNTADATSIFTYSEGPGILRRLWIAVNGTYANLKAVPGNVFLRINVDGVISVGNYSTNTDTTGYEHIPLALDLLFSPLGGAYYANALQGCNVFNNTSLGGYFTLDLPFRNSLDIRLYNNTSAPVTYWVQPFLTTFNTIPPSLSSVRLRSSTFRYTNTVCGNEYVLMDYPDVGNGVHLKYIRMHVIGASGNWWESRVRIYDGVNAPPGDGYVISPWTPYNGNNYQHFPGYDNTSRCIFSSSGLEDFYLSSWNGANLTSFHNESSGLLYQSNTNIGSTTAISFYRNFGHSETMPSVSTGRKMVVTLNSGDAQVGQSDSFLEVIGQVFYYA